MSLVLTAVGVYGVVAASVAGRMRELGVRAALGASSGDVVGLVMKEGLRLTAAGIVAGAAGAALLSRLAQSLLFGVSPTDPATFAVVALIVVAATALACFVPARRASRIDPMLALQAD